MLKANQMFLKCFYDNTIKILSVVNSYGLNMSKFRLKFMEWN